MHNVEIFFDDAVEGRLRGWAARIGTVETDDDHVELSLSIGSEKIGTVIRAVDRPDVDAHVSYGVTKKGFDLPLLAPLAFAEMTGLSAVHPVTLSVTGSAQPNVEIPRRFLQQIRTLQPVSGLVLPQLTLADIWFPSGGELRMRLDTQGVDQGGSDAGLTLIAYQAEFGPEPRLTRVGERQVAASGCALFTASLVSPLSPVLLALRDAQGFIKALDLVPFPSLCRGGLHDVELRASAVLGDDMQDLRRSSARLLGDLMTPEALPRSVGRLVVDTQGASGNERIFARDMLEWLARIIRIDVALAEDLDGMPDPALSDQLQALLHVEKDAPVPKEGGPSLVIPADSIPTIFAMTARRRLPGSLSSVTCSFIVRPLRAGGPAWAVGLPHHSSLADLAQPVGQTIQVPRLSADPVGTPEPGMGSMSPMVIRMPEPIAANPSSSLFPVAVQVVDLLKSHNRDGGAGVSVCIAIDAEGADGVALVESLAHQSLRPIDVVLSAPAGFRMEALAPLQKALDAAFPDAWQFVTRAVSSRRSELLATAAAHARGDVFVFVSTDVVLHDARTLATLAALAGIEGIGSASAMLLKAGSSRFEFAGAGYFLTGLSLTTPPAISFEPLAVNEALPSATYPVLANGGALLAVSRPSYVAVGGFDPDHSLSPGWDIDFGLRAIEAGYMNLCTTAITAFTGRGASGGVLDIDLLRRLPRLDLVRLAAMTTSLRRIL